MATLCIMAPNCGPTRRCRRRLNNNNNSTQAQIRLLILFFGLCRLVERCLFSLGVVGLILIKS